MLEPTAFSSLRNRPNELLPLGHKLLPLEPTRVRLKGSKKDQSADARNVLPKSLYSNSPARPQLRPKSRNESALNRGRESTSPPLHAMLQLRDQKKASPSAYGQDPVKPRPERAIKSRCTTKTIDSEYPNVTIPGRMPSKISTKPNGCVLAYAANTSPGLFRNYNEDRVSIILNFVKPAHVMTRQWPRCSFFGLYDGHAGSSCADYLRDNLHHYIVGNKFFPDNVELAIKKGIERAETEFLQKADSVSGPVDTSGSCAILALIVGETCYIANVGDSRAVLSSNKGTTVTALSRDHKPSDELEQKRILSNGGNVYRANPTFGNGPTPLRVLPGRLSVSRTIGDAHAKLHKFNGNPRVVVAEPEIRTLNIDDSHDFIFLGSDGMYDKLSNAEISNCIWHTINMNQLENMHSVCGKCVENVMKAALSRNTLDNITGVIITFRNAESTGTKLCATMRPAENSTELGLKMKNATIAISRESRAMTNFNYNSTEEVLPRQGHKKVNAESCEREKGGMLEKIMLDRLGRSIRPLGRNPPLLGYGSGERIKAAEGNGKSKGKKEGVVRKKTKKTGASLLPRVEELNRVVDHKALRSFDAKNPLPPIEQQQQSRR